MFGWENRYCMKQRLLFHSILNYEFDAGYRSLEESEVLGSESGLVISDSIALTLLNYYLSISHLNISFINQKPSSRGFHSSRPWDLKICPVLGQLQPRLICWLVWLRYPTATGVSQEHIQYKKRQ